MNDKNWQNINQYLNRFDQILWEMTTKMLTAPTTDNITINFIKTMIPHHQAAIYMCESLLKYTTYYPLQNIARRIIKLQTEGIKQMQNILKTTTGYENEWIETNTYMNKFKQITNEMVQEMKYSSRTMNINYNFVNEMIPHHKGAIAMCINLLQYNIDPRLKKVATSIIKFQSQGVKELERIKLKLISAHYSKPI